jgi:hypothetical protein
MNAQFFHHLHDTIILLGGGMQLANKVKHPDVLTDADVDELRRLNIRLLDRTKQRLVDINKTTIRPGGSD